jgi:hypothetical protein
LRIDPPWRDQHDWPNEQKGSFPAANSYAKAQFPDRNTNQQGSLNHFYRGSHGESDQMLNCRGTANRAAH